MSTARPEWDYWKHKPRWARFQFYSPERPPAWQYRASSGDISASMALPDRPSSAHPEYNVRFGIRRISSVAITASGSHRAFCAWASPRVAECAGCGSKRNIREGQVR